MKPKKKARAHRSSPRSARDLARLLELPDPRMTVRALEAVLRPIHEPDHTPVYVHLPTGEWVPLKAVSIFAQHGGEYIVLRPDLDSP